MKNYRFAFYQSHGRLAAAFGPALVAGAMAYGDQVVPIRSNTFDLDGFDGGAILGICYARASMEACLSQGKHFLMFDKGYMCRKWYFRVAVNAWQPLVYFQQIARPPDRFSELIRLGFSFSNYRAPETTGDIVVAGTSYDHNEFHGLGTNYYQDVVKRLSFHTARRIVYRPKPVKRQPSTTPSLLDQIRGAHLVVTHGSSAGLVAFAFGVPIMVLGESIAQPMALGPDDWERLEDPHWPAYDTRQQFFNDAAYCQWTSQEWSSGKAWAYLRQVLLSKQGL